MNWKDIFDKQLDGRFKISATGCWEFVGCIDTTGYGVIRVGGRAGFKAYAHRVSYLAFKGEIGNMQVQHECNNRKCYNPEHLVLGDHKTNARHMVTSGRNYVTAVGESGVRGVSPQRDGKYFYWIARMHLPGKQAIQLYRGKDFFEACCARKSFDAKETLVVEGPDTPIADTAGLPSGDALPSATV